MQPGDWIQLGAVGVAGFGVLAALLEYRRQGAAKRAEQLLEMRSRLRGNDKFVHICQLLETDAEELRLVPLLDKDNFIGFFEELTLLWNSRVLSDEIVYYMFGYFAIRCWDSTNFWCGLNRNSLEWSHFRDMNERLKVIRSRFEPSRRRFRL
jgi:hypothetical protein